MAPILIDNRDLLKLGILSVLTIVLAFVGGYQFGFQQANMHSDYVVLAESENLSLPEESVILVKDIEQQPSEISHVSKNIDVAPVDPVMQVTETKVVIAELEPEAVVVEEVDQAETTAKDNVFDEKNLMTSTTSSIASDEQHKIKYSIQVAVYGRLNNAEKMMDLLQAEKLDAYITDYVNKKNKVRFNVRFGYFKDKITALSALQDYVDDQKGDGYLVNYSAKNIVDVTQTATAIEQSVNTSEAVKQPVTIIQANNKAAAVPVSTYESTPVEIVPNSVSQTENTETSIDLKKAQGNSQIN